MKVIDRRQDDDETVATPVPEIEQPPAPERVLVTPQPVIMARCPCGQEARIAHPAVVRQVLGNPEFRLELPPCPQCGKVCILAWPEQPRVVHATAAPNRQQRRAMDAIARRGQHA